MDIKKLEDYSNAWNDQDIDRIMSYMTQDCIFETGSGSEKFGTRHEGFDTVKERFQAVWKDLKDVRFENGKHFVDGTRGCSEWTFLATLPDGSLLEVDGCDLFTFVGDKIRVKNSFLKNRQG